MKSLVVCLLVALAALAYGANEPPQVTDYAYQFGIDGVSEGGIYRLEVPLAFYRSASDLKLRDAAVFNAADVAVPRIFRLTEDELTNATTRENLPMLPVHTSATRQLDDIRMLVRRGDANAEVSFDASSMQVAEQGSRLSAYVIDTRARSKPFTDLAFEWPADVEQFLGKVTVDASNDLVSWQNVGGGALADLRDTGAQVKRNTVAIRAHDHDYLRLQWSEMPKDWLLTGVFGLNSIESRISNRQTLRLESTGTDDAGARLFEIGGSVSVDQVSITLPEPNSVVSGQLYYRQPGVDQWRLLTSGAFDNLEPDTAPVALPNIRTDALRFLPSNSSRSVEIVLDVGWRADTLMFLARGQAPFRLVVGNAAEALAGFPMQRDYEDRSLFRSDGKWRPAQVASLSSRSLLGGNTRLHASQPADWRQFILWAVLGFGVAIAGLMALRLIREMKTGSES